MFDLVIIGAGPAGISAAHEAKKLGLNYLVLEKGLIADTIYHYPIGLTVFSTINELEFEPDQLKPAREKPTREELLSYYVRFVLANNLNVNTEEEVLRVEKLSNEIFKITTAKADYQSHKVLFCMGAMAHPRRLNVKGENLPKVHHLFLETYPYVRKHALVIGGGNSAGEAALFLAEEGAETTLATFRADWENTDPKQGCIKHWVKEPLEEKIERHCLNVLFLNRVVEIREKEVLIESENSELLTLPNDVVFVLIGADADLGLLRKIGVETEQTKYGEIPVYNEETYETNVPGVYVAGHFTLARHIKGAIEVPKQIMPGIIKSLRRLI
jgi:putative YpdA family bacillithiol system oxidoreductase